MKLDLGCDVGAIERLGPKKTASDGADRQTDRHGDSIIDPAKWGQVSEKATKKSAQKINIFIKVLKETIKNVFKKYTPVNFFLFFFYPTPGTPSTLTWKLQCMLAFGLCRGCSTNTSVIH